MVKKKLYIIKAKFHKKGEVMKKLLMIAALACVGVSAYAADAATLYKKCAVCHGAKAEKVYLNKVPALKTISKAERLKYMKEYAAGTRNAQP